MGESPERGAAFVVQPDEGRSYWQPVPANGYAEVMVSRQGAAATAGGSGGFSSGIQVIAPGGHIREHRHGDADEILFFFEGIGTALVNGEEHTVRPGTMVYAGRGNRHKIINDGAADLKMMWMLSPGGLEDFFAAIGRPRTPGEAPPPPFARPDDVADIEARTVFAPLDDAPNRG